MLARAELLPTPWPRRPARGWRHDSAAGPTQGLPLLQGRAGDRLRRQRHTVDVIRTERIGKVQYLRRHHLCPVRLAPRRRHPGTRADQQGRRHPQHRVRLPARRSALPGEADVAPQHPGRWGTQQLFERCGDNWVPVLETDRKVGFDAWVAGGRIGLDYNTFTSSVLLLQGKAEKLLDSKPEGRREVLAGIVDLERFGTACSSGLDGTARRRRPTSRRSPPRLTALPAVQPLELHAARESASPPPRLNAPRPARRWTGCRRWSFSPAPGRICRNACCRAASAASAPGPCCRTPPPSRRPSNDCATLATSTRG